jgi:hypothetical protein
VAAGRTAPGDTRGGEGIQALRPTRTRVTTGGLALLALAGVCAASIAAAGHRAPAAWALTAAALALLSVGVALRLPLIVPWAVAFAAGDYVLTRTGGDVVDGWAAVAGAALLLAAELALWSATDDPRLHVERPVVVRRIVTIAALVLAGLLVGFLLLGAAAITASSGVVVAAAGVAAAVTSIAFVLRLLR